MLEAARNGFEIPGWSCGDYAGNSLTVTQVGGEIFANGLCFIRRDGAVLLATASAIQRLKHHWVRVRHSGWTSNQRRWCRLLGNTLIVYGPQGARQEFAMLPKTAVLVRPDGNIVALDLRILRLPDIMMVEHSCRVTVDDICPPLVLPTPIHQGGLEHPAVIGGLVNF